MITRWTAAAEAANLAQPFLYMNYAALQQSVIESYGAENVAKLQAVSQKYDPDQVFQILQPGYFKLP
jgi:hypothetical protein